MVGQEGGGRFSDTEVVGTHRITAAVGRVVSQLSVIVVSPTPYSAIVFYGASMLENI